MSYGHASELQRTQPPLSRLEYLIRQLGLWADANPSLRSLHSEFVTIHRELRGSRSRRDPAGDPAPGPPGQPGREAVAMTIPCSYHHCGVTASGSVVREGHCPCPECHDLGPGDMTPASRVIRTDVPDQPVFSGRGIPMCERQGTDYVQEAGS
jgi:hypothetical protein